MDVVAGSRPTVHAVTLHTSPLPLLLAFPPRPHHRHLFGLGVCNAARPVSPIVGATRLCGGTGRAPAVALGWCAGAPPAAAQVQRPLPTDSRARSVRRAAPPAACARTAASAAHPHPPLQYNGAIGSSMCGSPCGSGIEEVFNLTKKMFSIVVRYVSFCCHGPIL